MGTQVETNLTAQGMPEMVCPVCGEKALEYYDTDIQDAVFGTVHMKWECGVCGATGQDDFTLTIDSREID